MMNATLRGKPNAGNAHVQLLAVTLLFAAGVAVGADSYWKGGTGSKNWTDASAWTNSAGEVVSAPATVDDTATFPQATSSSTISLFNKDDTATAFSLAKIAAPLGWNFTFPERTTVGVSKSRLVSVGDASNVKGLWQTAELNCGLVLTGSGESKLSQVSGENRFVVDVATAGANVTLGALCKGGVLVKRGAGKLTVERVQDGAQAKIYAEAGSVELTGLSATGATYPKDGLLLHLNADDLTTLERHSGDDGRTYVSEWRDADGGAQKMVKASPAASKDLIAYAEEPFVSSYVSATGRHFVDFGSHWEDSAADKAKYGPTNCLMTVSGGSIAGVREAFYVAAYTPAGAKGNAAVLGSDFWKGNSRTILISNTSLGNPNVRAGDFYLNGTQVPFFQVFNSDGYSDRFSTTHADVHVMNYVPDGTAKVGYFGGTDAYLKRNGGMRVGEVLLYDRKLTDDERRAVTRYLMTRWLGDAADQDLQGLVVGSDDVAVSVPAGHVARVASIGVRGTKLVKTGEGILEVGSISPAGTILEVQGGSVRYISDFVDVLTNAPAANAYLRLDATKKDSMTTRTVGDVEYVDEWRDADGGTVYAKLPVSGTDGGYTGNSPVYKSAALNGNAIVDFGSKSVDSERAWFKLSKTGSANVYEGYIVYRFKNATSACRLFGGSNRDTLGSAYGFLNPSRCANGAAAATWTADGCVEDPTMNYSARHGTDFHVVSFASSSLVQTDFIANDRQTAVTSGDIEIGEYILYSRRLTAAERRQTEAYLMAKWLDAAHPLSTNGATQAGVSVAGTADGAEIAKAGSGTKTVALDEIVGVTKVSVTGGTLDMSQADPADKAYVHFDATDADSLVTETIKGKKYVSRWNDTRGNGLAAVSSMGQYGVATNPVLTTATIGGVSRSVVHFGRRYDSDQSGLYFEDETACQVNTREAHVVIADYAPGGNFGWLFGSRSSSSLYRPYGTSSTDPLEAKGQLFRSAKYSYTTAVANGYIAVDGVQTNVYGRISASDKPVGTEFHLLSIVPDGDVQLDSIGIAPSTTIGGIIVGEQVVYRTALTEKERARLQNNLMNKWFGPSPERALCNLDDLSVSGGATATFGSGAYICAERLSGSGTISAKSVSGVSDIVWKLGASPLTVAADLSFDETLTVTVADYDRAVSAGEYVILSNPAVAALTADRLVLDASALKLATAELFVRGNDLVIRYAKQGLILFVR